MKNLFLLLVFSLIITSCNAQRIERKPVKKVVAYVDKTKDVVRLDPTHDSAKSYYVNEGEFVHGKEYVFWLELITSDKERTVEAVVVGYAMTSQQAVRDQEKEVKNLSHRKIIK